MRDRQLALGTGGGRPARRRRNSLKVVRNPSRTIRAVNPDITEMRRENLTTLRQSLRGNDQHQDAGWLEPAIRVAQERLLGATTVSRPEGPIIGWIQI